LLGFDYSDDILIYPIHHFNDIDKLSL